MLRLVGIGDRAVIAHADHRAGAHVDELVDDRGVDDGPGTDLAVEQHDRVANHRPFGHPHAGRQDGVEHGAVDDASVADQGMARDGVRAQLGR